MPKSNKISSRTITNVRLTFAVSLIILICISVVEYLGSQDLIDNEIEIAESYGKLQVMENLYSLIVDAETSRRGFFITEKRDYLESYPRTVRAIDSVLRIIKVSMFNNQFQRYYIDTLDLYVKQRIDYLSRGIDLQERRGTNMGLHKPLQEKGLEIHDNIRTLISRIEFEEKKDISERSEIVKKSAEYSLLIMLGGIIISIIVLTFVYIFLERKISTLIHDPESHLMTREELEGIVRERTLEIAGINQRLNKEIEKQKRSQTMLKELERDYRGLFEQAHDAIIIFRPEDEVVIEVNQRACEVYNIPKEKFIGLSLKSISKNVPDGEKYIRDTMEQGSCYNLQTVHYRSDGTEMLMEMNATVVIYENRKVILSINRDITDRIMRLPLNKI